MRTDTIATGSATPVDRDRAELLHLAEGHHRLKTQLAVIFGWARTLEHSWRRLDEAQKLEAIALIRGAADNGVVLSNQLIQDARAGATRAALRVGPVDVAAVLRDAAALADGVSTGHRVRHVGHRGDAVVALADVDGLRQALDHLVENAIAYADAGTTVWLRADHDGDRVRIQVRDEGPGFPSGVDVLAPFQRGVADGRSSSGLGLTIVRDLVLAMGGAVELANHMDRGAVVTITLPAPPA